MLISYLPILILLAVAVLFPVGALVATQLLGPRVRTTVKGEAYECGVPAVGSTEGGLSVKFYRMAVLFLLVDVEAALLFPLAVLFREMAGEWGVWFLAGELFLFVAILMVGYVYAWNRGALEWD